MKYTINLDSIPEDKNEFLKIIRTIGALELAHASDIKNYVIENVPCSLVTGINKEVADYISDKIRDIGGKCTVEKSSIQVPMVLTPSANKKYDFGFLGIKKVE